MWKPQFFGLVQEFLILDLNERKIPAQAVVWMLNWKVREADWRFLPVELLVRGLVPEAIINNVSTRGSMFVMHVLDPSGQPLVESSLRVGCWISLANLTTLFAHMKLEKPTQGSGKRLMNGKKRIIKIDWANKLIRKTFPEEQDEQELMRMIRAVTFRSSKALTEEESKILECVSELDPENQEEFKEVVKLAKRQIMEKAEKKARAKAFSELQEQEEAKRKQQKEEEQEEKKRLEIEEQKRQAELEKAAKAASEVVERAAPAAGQPSSSSGTRKPSTTPKDG